MEIPTKNGNASKGKEIEPAARAGDKGSIILVVLMVLVLLTLGGIAATDLVITESHIVRNTAIHKQNLQLAEMAALEGLRFILTENDPRDLAPGGAGVPDWFRDVSVWDNDPTKNSSYPNGFPLTDDNSTAPAAELLGLLDQRGETADTPLRYYFVGWRTAPNSSLVMTATQWQQGRVIAVYDSDRYGLASVELGVIKRF